MWKFLVKNQSIEVLEREVLADHQIQYVQFRFTFDGDWKRFHKVVQFSQCDETYNIVLGVDGTSLYLPAELHVGAAKMSVFGYDTTVRATTVPVTLNIRPSGFVGDDDPPIPPTPDLYAQLLKRIEDAEKGLDGKSAYEIAVEHGYVGTETEWLASLKGEPGETPDMSEYPKTYEVTTIVEREIEAATGDFHSHANKATLDAFTPELLQELSGLQQFEDGTKYEIQTINEELLTLNAQRHTHNNKDVLDSITQEMLDGIAGAERQAHTHHNLATLNGITDSHVSRWEEAYSVAMNLNERVGVNEGVFERFKTEILYDMQGCRTSISDILTRLSAVETELSGVETTPFIITSRTSTGALSFTPCVLLRYASRLQAGFCSPISPVRPMRLKCGLCARAVSRCRLRKRRDTSTKSSAAARQFPFRSAGWAPSATISPSCTIAAVYLLTTIISHGKR